ncbi:MAG TPA: hypothetical protein VE258_06960 [Ktedonobacterales bacterium]|nr:hypothetical protein [Ktedonobacterales bacterium]
MNFTPAAALALWAVGTAWLILYVILERLDPYWGEEPVDWIQAASVVFVLGCYPFFRKRFAAWLARRTTR